MVNNYTISSAGINLIKSNEHLRLQAYLDPLGIPTIGYGSTTMNGINVVLGDELASETEATNLLITQLQNFERCVNSQVSVILNQNQFDALVDFTFNVGCGAFESSHLLLAINGNKGLEAICEQFDRWIYGHIGGVRIELPGLVERRKKEKALWLLQPQNDAYLAQPKERIAPLLIKEAESTETPTNEETSPYKP